MRPFQRILACVLIGSFIGIGLYFKIRSKYYLGPYLGDRYGRSLPLNGNMIIILGIIMLVFYLQLERDIRKGKKGK